MPGRGGFDIKQERTQSEPFIIRVEGTLANGKEISPETLSIEKFALLFQRFRRLVEVSLAENKEQLKEVNFRYERGSAACISDLPRAALRTIQTEVREAVKDHPAVLIQPGIATSLIELKQFVTELGGRTHIILGSREESYAVITRETPLEQLRDKLVETETIVYGKLFAVGGKAPNFHLTLTKSGETRVIVVTEKESKAQLLKGYFSGDGSIFAAERGKFMIEACTISKELANDLYSEIGVKVALRQSLLTREVVSAKFLEKLPFSRTLDEAKFKRDKKIGTKVWAGIGPVAWEREQRGVAL